MKKRIFLLIIVVLLILEACAPPGQMMQRKLWHMSMLESKTSPAQKKFTICKVWEKTAAGSWKERFQLLKTGKFARCS